MMIQAHSLYSVAGDRSIAIQIASNIIVSGRKHRSFGTLQEVVNEKSAT